MSLDAGAFPHRPPVDDPDPDTRVVQLDTEEAATLCGRLASETATSILVSLFDEPMTASDVADRVDTSLQNAHYHLDRLAESDLVRVVDTWYSSRGVEMKVYAPSHDEFVISLSPDGRVDGADEEANAADVETGDPDVETGDSDGEGATEPERRERRPVVAGPSA
jgi:DNA-binding transcriptional ArsR family regulator